MKKNNIAESRVIKIKVVITFYDRIELLGIFYYFDVYLIL